MTTNPFRYLCIDCGSPWKEGAHVCWNCGSPRFADNPSYGQTMPARPVIMTPVTFDRPKTKTESTTWALISSILLALGAFGLAYGVFSFWTAFFIGIMSFSVTWTGAQVSALNQRSVRIENMLTDLTARR